LIGIVTYNEGEAAFDEAERTITVYNYYTDETTSETVYGAIDYNLTTVEYITTSECDDYRNAIIFFTFILGNNIFTKCYIDIFIIIRYSRLYRKKIVTRMIPPKTSCWKAGLAPKLLIELLICSTVSPPGINITFSGLIDGGYFEYR
jgi:hypothetical protein